jgi:hypothetical protein
MSAARINEARGRRRVAAAEDAGVDVRAGRRVEAIEAEAGAVVRACAVFFAGYKLAASSLDQGSLAGRLTIADALYLVAAGPACKVLDRGGARVAGRTGQRGGCISADVAACCDAAGEEGVFDLCRLCDGRVRRP